MRQAEMYFFNIMQHSVGPVKKGEFFFTMFALFQQAQLLHHVKKVHFGLAHLHLLN